MKITNKETNEGKELLYIGSDNYEDYYLSFQDDDVRGWSFMGLRPSTEQELRTLARDIDPEDFIGDLGNFSHYFDHDRFADDMEEDWHERHDVHAEREQDGETLYLGHGSGQDIFGYFKKNKITNYKKYQEHFEEIGLNEKNFDFLNKIIKEANKKDKSGVSMTDEEQAEEKKIFTDYFITNKK